MWDESGSVCRAVVVYAVVALLAGCGGSAGEEPPGNGGNSAPTLSGIPVTGIMVGQAYRFAPQAEDSDGDRLTFSGTSIPSWASINSDTGVLSGTPAGGDEGATSGIIISVSDAQSSAELPAFALTVYADSTAGNGGTGAIQFSNTQPAGYVWDTLATGRLMFVDQPTLLGIDAANPVPSQYQGLDYLRPAASDNDSTGDAFVSFDVDIPILLYVAHADSVTNKPAWLDASWTDTGDDFEARSIYRKRFPAGTVTLGGNKADSADPGEMYLIFMAPAQTGSGSVTLRWTPPATYTSGETIGDLDGYEIHYGVQPGSYTNTVVIDNEALSQHTVTNLPAGTYYFNIKAFTSGTGAPRSDFAGEVMVTVGAQ